MDKYCINIFNFFFYAISILLTPLKIICKVLTNFFQRPYSFLFFINHFTLMTPSILLLVTFINNNDNIKKRHITKFYYLQLFSFGLNYYFNFIIYTLYQEHNLNYGNMNKITVVRLSKIIQKYISNHYIIIIILIFYLINILISIFTMVKIWNLLNLYIERDFLIIASIINICFSGGYIILYIFLLFILFCSIKNCCVFGLCSNKTLKHYISFDNLNLYLKISLNFFQFIGIFDYEKLLIQDLSSSSTILNENTKIRISQEKPEST